MHYLTWMLTFCFLAACVPNSAPLPALKTSDQQSAPQTLSAAVYLDKVHGAWQATMVANHTGLELQGVWLDEPGPGEGVDLLLLDEWSTDDDTAIEWVALHILETHGLNPTYAQIRDEWVAHLNNDIWVSTRRARDLMDEGILPPETGSAALNPGGVWSIDAQLQTELFGLIAPGLPDEAGRRARTFAHITNSGLAIAASDYYARLYARAFFESDVPTLIQTTKEDFAPDSPIQQIVSAVQSWHKQHPNDWRITRQLIHDVYDHDPQWWAAQVNFAATIMALLYGEGELLQTINLAALAGWDADNNMATSAGLLGLIHGFANLPDPIRTASDVYFNQDVTGDLPPYDTITNFALRTQQIAEQTILANNGRVTNGIYTIPLS